MDKSYLYRGINQKMYKSDRGVLLPKSTGPFSHVFEADGSIKADGSVIAGPSTQNAVLGHQLNSAIFHTSGISTTPIFERAKHYATNDDGRSSLGYVFKLDRKLFERFGIEEYIVSRWVEKPSKPEDDEVILVAQDLKELPVQVIVEIIEVNAQR